MSLDKFDAMYWIGSKDDIVVNEHNAIVSRLVARAEKLTAELDRIRAERDAARAALAHFSDEAGRLEMRAAMAEGEEELLSRRALSADERAAHFRGVAAELSAKVARQRRELRRLNLQVRNSARPAKPPKLSEEARAARAPRPPEELVGALQDRIHPASGSLLSASPIVTARAKAKPAAAVVDADRVVRVGDVWSRRGEQFTIDGISGGGGPHRFAWGGGLGAFMTIAADGSPLHDGWTLVSRAEVKP